MNLFYRTLVVLKKNDPPASADLRLSNFCIAQKPARAERRNLVSGFSMIELIIAVTIFLILSTMFLINYGSFDRRITIDTLAHQIAVWIHDAQVSAMSVRHAQNADDHPGYGIHFDTATPKKFIFFADLNYNNVYDAPGGGAACGTAGVECEQEIALLKGNVVASLCGDVSSGGPGPDCSSANPGNPMLYSSQVLDIVFVRPDPTEAIISGNAATRYSHAEITVSSPMGYHHTITAWVTGQVSVR